jgi:hypothetical protein
MTEPNIDRLVQELNEATASDLKAAVTSPRALRPVPDTASKADKLISLARGSHEQVKQELAMARRNHSVAYVNIIHDANAEIERIKAATAAKLENLDAETGREIQKMEELLELYSRIKF